MGIHGGGQQKGGLGPTGGPPCENRGTQGSNINVKFLFGKENFKVVCFI